jgi:HK97 family phage prohead protease
MSSELTRALSDAVIERGEKEGDGRTIDLRLMRWDEVAEHTAEGFKESFTRGAFKKVDPARVTLEAQKHGGPLVGVATEIQERDEDAVASFRVAKTPAGDELLELARSGVLRDASVVFAPISHRERDDGVIERTAVDLRRVALLERGAYPSAELLSVREETNEETNTVTDNIQMAEVDLAPVMERLESIETKVGTIEAMGSGPAIIKPKYLTLADYTSAVYERNEDPELLYRALTENETANNPGVIPENWLKDVKRVVNLGRRAISGFGGPRPLGERGMTVDYPYLTSANTLIASHTEVAEVQTARVDIAKGSEDILTFAGGSMISYQLAQRSDPSYREAYNRIMLNAWANVTDDNFVSQLEADATGAMLLNNNLGAPVALSNPSAHADDIFDTGAAHGFSAGDAVVFTALTGGDATTAALVGRVVWVIPTSLAAQTFRISLSPGGAAFVWGTADLTAGTVCKLNTTADAFRESLFQASVYIEAATGSPASVVLASTDVFLGLSGMSDIVAPGPSAMFTDPSGVASAATLRMVSSGLEIIHDANVTAGKLVVSNSSAAGWHEKGPIWATAEDVAQLGTQVAVYSFGAGVVYVPAGVYELTFV